MVPSVASSDPDTSNRLSPPSALSPPSHTLFTLDRSVATPATALASHHAPVRRQGRGLSGTAAVF